MAARKPWPFYVYDILGADGSVIYIGKGCGRRMRVSMAERSGSDCREVVRFRREADAYQYEIERIAQYKPAQNKHAGGNGSKATVKRAPRKLKWELDIERIGSKKYAARLIVAAYECCKRARTNFCLTDSEVDRIRAVAYG